MCSKNTIPPAFRQLIFFKFDHLWRGKTLNLLLLDPSLFDTSCTYLVAKQLCVRWWENIQLRKIDWEGHSSLGLGWKKNISQNSSPRNFLGPKKKLGELPNFLDFATVRCGWKKFPKGSPQWLIEWWWWTPWDPIREKSQISGANFHQIQQPAPETHLLSALLCPPERTDSYPNFGQGSNLSWLVNLPSPNVPPPRNRWPY